MLAAVATAGALTLVGIGCGTGTPPPSATPTKSTASAITSSTAPRVTASASAAVSPTPPPTDPGTVFAADGVGPYLIGAQLIEMQGRALVTGAADSQTCAGTTTAAATGRYAGVISLSFVGGQLVSVRTASSTLVTPSGAKVGMTFADAQTLYGGRGTLITAPSGTKAMVLRVTGAVLALVLYLDPTNATVASIGGGQADRLESSARTGDGC